MLVTDQIYEVTGELTPDITGTYNPIGPYNSMPSYEIAATGWFIWWDGSENWKITSVLGVEEEDFWTRNNVSIEGIYTPGGTAIGDATVSEI